MIIGIDEVGRGPIAGPVCVCAFGWKGKQIDLKKKIREVKRRMKLDLHDSKQLSRAGREDWFRELKKWKAVGECDFTITLVHAPTIDRIGIAPSIRRALSKSLHKLHNKPFDKFHTKFSRRTFLGSAILLDGGLRAPAEFTNQITIIKGDEKEAVIALASIVAKVHRDNLMFRMSKKHTKYGFENHVGYGTKAHYAAIKKFGLTGLHRTSFLSGLY